MLTEPALAGNDWVVRTYWPENQARVRLVLTDLLSRRAPGADMRVLDVGCYNGYISFLLARLGYRVTATDALESTERSQLFAREGIGFFSSNLNRPAPFRDLPEASFEAGIMGEVIEHILHHPLGLLEEMARILKPGGVLILTTPNPSTVLNAIRLLGGRSFSWGATEFMRLPKLVEGQLTTFEGIHYHEYTAGELFRLLGEAGFSVEKACYLGMGASAQQALWKRLIKGNLLTKRLMSLRLFGCTHYVVARRRSDAG
ncbi:MAG: class I SAM-dependent methyltransferase [Limisphaerales bacterium]